MNKDIRIGAAGELFAKEWFERNAYHIIAQNWRATSGEIDLIAEKNNTLVFVEVKTFPHTTLIDLDIIIGKKKQEKICKTAKYFLLSHAEYNNMYVRFDLFVLPFDPRKLIATEPIHLENAFEDYIYNA